MPDRGLKTPVTVAVIAATAAAVVTFYLNNCFTPCPPDTEGKRLSAQLELSSKDLANNAIHPRSNGVQHAAFGKAGAELKDAVAQLKRCLPESQQENAVQAHLRFAVLADNIKEAANQAGTALPSKVDDFFTKLESGRSPYQELQDAFSPANCACPS